MTTNIVLSILACLVALASLVIGARALRKFMASKRYEEAQDSLDWANMNEGDRDE